MTYTFTNTEASAYVARMTVTPSDPRCALIDNYVGALKTAGIWTKLDALYIHAAADQQSALLNAVQNAYNETIVGTVTFTTDRGLKSSLQSGANYLTTGFNPTSASSPKFTQNSANKFGWGLETTVHPAPVCGSATTQLSYIFPAWGDGNGYTTLNGPEFSIASTDASGLWATSRVASTGHSTYKNGALLGLFTGTSTGVDNSIFQGLRDANTTNTLTNNLAIWGFGSGLTGTEETALYNATLTYLQGVGAVAGGATTTPKTVSPTPTGTVTITRSVTKKLAPTSTSTVALARSVAKNVAVTSASAVAVTRRAAKGIAATSTSVVSSVRSTIKSILATSASAVTATASRAYLRTITVLSTSAVSQVKGSAKSVASVCASSVTWTTVRAYLKAIAATSSSVVTQAKGVKKSIAATASGSVVAAASRATIKAISIVSTTAVSSTRAAGKILAAALATTSTISPRQALSRSISVLSTSASSVVKGATKKIAVLSSSVSLASGIRVAIVFVSAACASSVTKAARVSKNVTVASTSSVLAAKAIAKRLAVSIASAASLSLTKAYLRTVSVAATSTATMSRATGKAISASVSSLASVAKRAAIGVYVTATSVSSALSDRSQKLYAAAVAVAAHTSVVWSWAIIRLGTVTPPERIAHLAREDRVATVPAEVRIAWIAAENRTAIITTNRGSDMTSIATWPIKDPDEVKDYAAEWSALLGPDTIATSTWTLSSGSGLALGAQSNTDKATTIWFSGGVDGANYVLVNRITTAAGRTFDRSFALKVRTL
jgi:hypothetical protein